MGRSWCANSDLAGWKIGSRPSGFWSMQRKQERVQGSQIAVDSSHSAALRPLCHATVKRRSFCRILCRHCAMVAGKRVPKDGSWPLVGNSVLLRHPAATRIDPDKPACTDEIARRTSVSDYSWMTGNPEVILDRRAIRATGVYDSSASCSASPVRHRKRYIVVPAAVPDLHTERSLFSFRCCDCNQQEFGRLFQLAAVHGHKCVSDADLMYDPCTILLQICSIWHIQPITKSVPYSSRA